jgi:hypothetical protein
VFQRVAVPHQSIRAEVSVPYRRRRSHPSVVVVVVDVVPSTFNPKVNCRFKSRPRHVIHVEPRIVVIVVHTDDIHRTRTRTHRLASSPSRPPVTVAFVVVVVVIITATPIVTQWCENGQHNKGSNDTGTPTLRSIERVQPNATDAQRENDVFFRFGYRTEFVRRLARARR